MLNARANPGPRMHNHEGRIYSGDDGDMLRGFEPRKDQQVARLDVGELDGIGARLNYPHEHVGIRKAAITNAIVMFKS
jgi:hypothetical protein